MLVTGCWHGQEQAGVPLGIGDLPSASGRNAGLTGLEEKSRSILFPPAPPPLLSRYGVGYAIVPFISFSYRYVCYSFSKKEFK